MCGRPYLFSGEDSFSGLQGMRSIWPHARRAEPSLSRPSKAFLIKYFQPTYIAATARYSPAKDIDTDPRTCHRTHHAALPVHTRCERARSWHHASRHERFEARQRSNGAARSRAKALRVPKSMRAHVGGALAIFSRVALALQQKCMNRSGGGGAST